MKKVIIAGSRGFNDYDLLVKTVEDTLKEPFVLVCGGAKGADSLGEQYAKMKGYPIERYLPKWSDLNAENCVIKYNKYGAYNAMAGNNRNKEMLEAVLKNEDGGLLIAFWDGKSKGTKNMIDISEKASLPFVIVRY